MAEKPNTPAPEPAASTGSQSAAGNASTAGSTTTDAPKSAPRPGNPAFRALGLPRIRLPSRNWLIFLSITGSFASAVIYDKYQTRRVNEKWARLVSHIPKEPLDNKSMPRKMTIYLAAPPGDGLRTAREHFHTYVKPVLVAAAMDWDVVEGRKEGDVRYKTAERIRKKRKRNGEGEPLTEEELENLSLVDSMRERTGTKDFDGIAGDLVIGRHTWKEYIRGLHEGWLGPVDLPKQPGAEQGPDVVGTTTPAGQPSLGDVAVQGVTNSASASPSGSTTIDGPTKSEFVDEASPEADPSSEASKAEEEKKDEAEEEKPKPRQPPPYLTPADYSSATASRSIPELLGPSIGVRFPHILGFRNTPIRTYRFLNRRHLADSIGRDVAAAVLAAHRPYSTDSSDPAEDGGSDSSELTRMLKHEEKNWWKTTFQPRKEHEESVWIEDIVLDERITNRMRAFQLTAEDEDRARRIAAGTEKPEPTDSDES